MCKRYFSWSLGIGSHSIYQPTSGCTEHVSAPRRFRKGGNATKARQVVDWLVECARYYQISPDNDLVLLPYADKAAVYGLFKEESKRAGLADEKIAKQNYFLSLWNTEVEVQHIRIRRWLRFAVCDECIGYRQSREETRDYKVRDRIVKEEFAHHTFVRGERHGYYKRSQAENAISVIIDGSDNSQYWSPYFKDRSSSGQSAWKVALHVMGAIVHGSRAYAYTILDTCPLGANVTIDILHRVLVAELASNGKLPRVLYLQLDNTTRQCKNQYLMAWMAYLVHIGLFDEVYVSFLPKGHTHEDIDQMFSCIARYLRKHDCPSPHAFKGCIQEAYTYNGVAPVVEHLTHVANIKDWLKPFIAKLDTITGGTERPWHQYHFKAHDGGEAREVRMRVREWISTRDDRSFWTGLEDQKTDSAVFLTDEKTKLFLSCRPFDVTPPPIARKPKRTSTQAGEEVRDTAKRLMKDVEKLIVSRHIQGDDVVSLRAAVAKLNALDDVDPLKFDWGTAMYTDAYEAMAAAERQRVGVVEVEVRDTELERANLDHPVGTVWAVRSDFADKPGWEKKAQGKLEMAWLVTVTGPVVRGSGPGHELQVPVRYYESSKTLRKCRDKSMRRQYKLGGSKEDEFAVADLQLKLKLNAPHKNRFATIEHYSGVSLKHWTKRWWESAKQDLQAGAERR